MMFSNNEKISVRQLQSLIFVDFISLFMVLLPRYIFEKDALGAISALIMAFGVGALVLFLSVKIAGRENKRRNEIILKLVCLFLIFKTFVVNGVYLKMSQEPISSFLFEGKSRIIIALVMSAFAFMVCKNGIEQRGRLAEIGTSIILFSVFLIFLLVFHECDIREMKDALMLSKESFEKELNIILLFSGIESIFFIFPFVNRKQKDISKQVTAAFILLGLISILLSSEAVCLFGRYEISYKMWPVLQMMNDIDFPTLLLERQDVLFIGMYIVGISMYTAFTVYFLSVYIQKIFTNFCGKKLIFLTSAVVFVSTIIFDENAVEALINISMYLNLAAFAVTFAYAAIWGEV